MENYKYTLDKSSKKFDCPLCTKKTFVKYIDTDTKEYLPETVGRCDRSDHCGYRKTPSEYFKENNIKIEKENIIRQLADRFMFEFEYTDRLKDEIKSLPGCKFDGITKHWYIESEILNENIKDFARKFNFRIIEYKPQPKITPSYIPYEIVEKTLDNNLRIKNNFFTHLVNIFGKSVAIDLFVKFWVSSSKHFEGATLFWQVDNEKYFRTGKIIQYETDKIKRTKNFSWVHKVLNLENFNLQQCFFGLHQINENPEKIIGIVESEKTAIIMTGLAMTKGIYKDYIWLATGSKTNIRTDWFKPCLNYKLVLYPDLGKPTNINGEPIKTAFELWTEKAAELSQQGFKISVSDLLETHATPEQCIKGYDLADFVLENLQNNSVEDVKKLLSKDDEKFNYLLNKNPELLSLVSVFELVNVNTKRAFEVA